MAIKNGRIKREDAIFIGIDYQEKLMPVMADVDRLRDRLSRLSKGLGVLGVPAIVTEQYPKGIGATENKEELTANLDQVAFFEKTSFSAFGNQDFVEALKTSGKKTAILAGIETHICVQQTALDLLEMDMKVYLVVDACSSRSLEDKKYAIKRMEAAGVALVTTEVVLFEMINGNEDAEFKQISKIIK